MSDEAWLALNAEQARTAAAIFERMFPADDAPGPREDERCPAADATTRATSADPSDVARLMRCASPPESVDDSRSSDR